MGGVGALCNYANGFEHEPASLNNTWDEIDTINKSSNESLSK